MKNLSLIVLSIFFSLNLFGQQPKSPGTTTKKTNEYNYFEKNPNFKINFFGIEPSISENPVETEIGTIYMTTYMYEKTMNEIYMVAISDFPEEHIAGSDKTGLLEGAKNGYCNNLNMSVSNSKTVYIDSHQGIYFEASSSDNYYTAAADYLVKNRLYQIAILRIDRMPSENEIKDFIFSFKLK
jgi:hypothetical protein